MLGTITLNAQMRYVPGDTVKGKNATYYCVKLLPKRVVRVRNIQNKDTLSTTYIRNGEKVSGDYIPDSKYAFKHEDFVQILKGVLTPQELELIKNGKDNLGIEFTVDKTGNAREITFVIRYSDPVFSRIEPDKLHELEVKLKQLLKIELGQQDREISNLKYWISVDYRNDL